MSRSPVRLLVLAVLPLLASCNLLMPMAVVGVHKKRVPPEFDKLAGSRVAFLVWTDPSTLFDYPYARLELSTYLGDKLHAEMAQRDQAVQVVDPRDVEDFLQKNPDARIDPAAVGRKFDANYVVYVEVASFQIRDPGEPQFLRGRINASVSVHDVMEKDRDARRYELAPVEAIYPEEQPVLLSATNSPLVREATYRKFAEMVARKFYEYTIEL
jgi:hypothetical protein